MQDDNTILCSELNCDRPKYCRGICQRHYARAYYRRRHPGFRPRGLYEHCTVGDCRKRHWARGFCNKHYRRWEKHGDPLKGGRLETVVERFWSRVHKTETCWLWTGAVSSNGYGAFSTGSTTDDSLKQVSAHRYVYELLKGAISDGLTIDHLCRVRNCVNPDHLEMVTQRENTRRGTSPVAHNAKKTHCTRGHLFSANNTWTAKNGARHCRTCQRNRQKAI